MKPFFRDLFAYFCRNRSHQTPLSSRILHRSHDSINNRKHKQILNECLVFLTNNGIDVDNDLKSLIEFFFSTDKHIAFDDIRLFVNQNKLNISDTSIRDAFALLVEYGFAMERIFGDNLIRYEHLHLGEHHDHFYCLKCGRIIEFYSQEIEDAQISEARAHLFHAFHHKMQIHGLCNQCFGTSSQNAIPLSKVESGGKFRITEIADSEKLFHGLKMRQRIMDMGILPGIEGMVITNHGGRIVLLINNSRVALGRTMSQEINVTLIE